MTATWLKSFPWRLALLVVSLQWGCRLESPLETVVEKSRFSAPSWTDRWGKSSGCVRYAAVGELGELTQASLEEEISRMQTESKQILADCFYAVVEPSAHDVNIDGLLKSNIDAFFSASSGMGLADIYIERVVTSDGNQFRRIHALFLCEVGCLESYQGQLAKRLGQVDESKLDVYADALEAASPLRFL